MPKLQKFTVLLRYPDYWSGNWPDDQVSRKVKATNPETAATKARAAEFRTCQRSEDEKLNDRNDLAVVAIYAGHHTLLAGANSY